MEGIGTDPKERRIKFISFISFWVIVLVIGLCLGSKDKKPAKSTPPPPPVEASQPQEQREPQVWSSTETGLPVGVVTGGSRMDETPSENWLSIKDASGQTHILKNVDYKVWDAVQRGDIIK